MAIWTMLFTAVVGAVVEETAGKKVKSMVHDAMKAPSEEELSEIQQLKATYLGKLSPISETSKQEKIPGSPIKNSDDNVNTESLSFISNVEEESVAFSVQDQDNTESPLTEYYYTNLPKQENYAGDLELEYGLTSTNLTDDTYTSEQYVAIFAASEEYYAL